MRPRLPLPKSRFNAFASAALVIILMSIAVAFKSAASWGNSSAIVVARRPSPIVETVIVDRPVSPTPTETPTETIFEKTWVAKLRWTPTPYQSPTPTKTATPIWLWDDQTGNQLDTREGTVSP